LAELEDEEDLPVPDEDDDENDEENEDDELYEDVLVRQMKLRRLPVKIKYYNN
jgi:E3 ubiquitin-protein ligase HECTD1